MDISDSDDDDENLPRSFDQCHQALQLIGRYVPSTSCFLMPILIENFPFVQKSSRTLECYVHNLLRVAVYIPSLRRDVLELIISRMLKLDVSAPRGEIEDVEENAVQQELKGEQEEEGLFDMDEDVCSVNSSPAGTNVMVHPVAERLDTLMVVLLAFIKDMCHVNGCLDVERTKDLYKDLVCVFDKLSYLHTPPVTSNTPSSTSAASDWLWRRRFWNTCGGYCRARLTRQYCANLPLATWVASWPVPNSCPSLRCVRVWTCWSPGSTYT